MKAKLASLVTSAVLAFSCTVPTVSSADWWNYDDIEETGFGYTVVEYDNTKYSAVLMDVPEVKVNEYSDTVEELVIPGEIEGFKVRTVCLYDHDMYNIRHITLPSTVENIIVEGTGEKLLEIDVDENNPCFCSVDGVLYTKDMKKLVAYPAGRDDTSFTVPDGVEEIGERAFAISPSLEEIVFPDSLRTIDKYALYTKNLKNLTIPASAVIHDPVIYDRHLDSITLLREDITDPYSDTDQPFEYDGLYNVLGAPVPWTPPLIMDNAPTRLYVPASVIDIYRKLVEDKNYYAVCIPLELKLLPDQKYGDINCDNEINIADAVTLQNFILGTGDGCAHGADLNNDGVLDIFDLITLKKLIIEQ
ncbi:leucine-rich repeat protein [Ruminococcus flavefaciens]|uniref:leucine-rich repeat protein n=1 Tax=Ruminococcus flavefaciens TaxID=1265 RepID=UPI000491153A|nr:leucine-rich repeat protein [Ruminococcus flavefaciens]